MFGDSIELKPMSARARRSALCHDDTPLASAPCRAPVVAAVCCWQHQGSGPFDALVLALQEALDACPALPGAAVAASVDDCLRRPSRGATWSLRSTPKFVRGLLSLVSRSPRSLCQVVVPVLVRFVAETECQANGKGCVCLRTGDVQWLLRALWRAIVLRTSIECLTRSSGWSSRRG